jgi:hypothetical protein
MPTFSLIIQTFPLLTLFGSLFPPTFSFLLGATIRFLFFAQLNSYFVLFCIISNVLFLYFFFSPFSICILLRWSYITWGYMT